MFAHFCHLYLLSVLRAAVVLSFLTPSATHGEDAQSRTEEPLWSFAYITAGLCKRMGVEEHMAHIACLDPGSERQENIVTVVRSIWIEPKHCDGSSGGDMCHKNASVVGMERHAVREAPHRHSLYM